MDEFNNKPEIQESENKELGEDFNKFKIQPKISPITAAFIGLFGGFFLYQFVGGLLTLLIFGIDLKNAPVNSMRLMTMAGQLLFILLPALIFAKFFYEDVTEIIRFKFPKWEEILLFTLGMIILTPLIQYYLSIQNYFIDIWAASSPFIHSAKSLLDKLNDLVDKTYGDLLSAHSVVGVLLVIIVVSIVPAVCEEVMFRGYVQRSFEFKMKPIWAALITAVFFGLYHFNPYALLPLIALGFYFGFAAYKSDSIFVPMSMHFLNNFVAVILFFIYGDDNIINSTVDKDFKLGPAVMMFIGLLVLLAGVIYIINRYYLSKVKK
jgi:CAAX protease family protein